MPSNIIDSLKGSLQTTEERLIEDRLYEAIHHELESNDLHPAAHTRAMAEGGDSEGLIKQAYIKHRLRMLKDELQFIDKATRAASEQQRVQREQQRVQREQEQRDADAYRQAKLNGRSDEQIELDRRIAEIRKKNDGGAGFNILAATFGLFIAMALLMALLAEF